MIDINSNGKIVKQNLIPFLLVLFYFSEALNKYFIFTEGSTILLTKLIKSVVLAVLLVIIAINLKKKKIVFHIILLVSLFITAQLTIKPNFDLIIISNFIKYLFPIVLFWSLKNNDSEKTFKIYEWLLVFNSILIVAGFVFEINIFNTYRGSRFGYNGLLVTSATSTYFYIIALAYLYFKHKKRIFKAWLTYLIIISMVLLGTKSVFLAFVFFLGVFIVSNYSKKIAFIGISLLIVFCFTVFLNVFFGDNFFGRITTEKGVLTSLLSYRNELFFNRTLPYINENWNFVNYLIGGINNISTRSQMGFIDIFYFFGIIGGFYYLFLYCKSFYCIKLDKSISIYFFFILFVAFFSGNFFLNASIPIYMVILRSAHKFYKINYSKNS